MNIKNETFNMYEFSNTIVFSGSFILSVLILKFLLKLSTPKRYPKGPLGFPLIGHLPFFGKNPPEVFRVWRKRYGDIFSIRLGSWKTVVISGYGNITEATGHGDEFSSRPDFFTQKVLKERDNGADSLAFGPFNDIYLFHRKITLKALRMVTMSRDLAVEEMMAAEASKLARCLNDESEKVRCEGIFIKEHVQFRTGSIIYQILYGIGRNIDENNLFTDIVNALKAFMEFNSDGNPLDVMPWLRIVMKKQINQFVDLANVALCIRDIKIKQHLSTFNYEDGIRDVTDALIALDMQNEENYRRVGLTRHHVLCTVSDLLGAGFETINTTIVWMVMYMTAYPEVQDRVRKEINNIISPNANVTWQDRRLLPFTYATVHEILGIASILPFSMPHYTTKDTTLNNYDIDKDTVVLFNLHSVHFDREYWGDPETFRPERFLDANVCLDEDKCRRILAFGVGRRQCVGEQIAKMELFIVFSTLIRECMFYAVETPDLAPVAGMVYKSNPVRVRVTDASVV